MLLIESKYSFLKNAKGLCFSEKYCIFCTGRRAIICDRKLNLLHTVQNLSYVYHASVSPDEKELLLISNSNVFYLIDLEDYSLKKQIIRGKYRDNLEGRGCWSLDGKSLYFAVCNPKSLNSALRCYEPNDSMKFNDMLEEKYWLVSIKSINELGKYLLIGLDRKKANADRIDQTSMIWFDGVSFEEYPICNMDVSNDVMTSAEYEAATNAVILYGISKTFRCDLKGKVIEDLSMAEAGKITISFSNVIKNIGLDNDSFDKLKELSALLGMEDVSIDDSIYKICLSSDGKKYYIGTHLGIFVLDAETKVVLAEKKIDYGVQDVVEVSPNVIFVSTWSGVKVFEIVN